MTDKGKQVLIIGNENFKKEILLKKDNFVETIPKEAKLKFIILKNNKRTFVVDMNALILAFVYFHKGRWLFSIDSKKSLKRIKKGKRTLRFSSSSPLSIKK